MCHAREPASIEQIRRHGRLGAVIWSRVQQQDRQRWVFREARGQRSTCRARTDHDHIGNCHAEPSALVCCAIFERNLDVNAAAGSI
jgi:hypothetical protein